MLMDYLKPITSHRRKPHEADGSQNLTEGKGAKHLAEGEGHKTHMCYRCECARPDYKRARNCKFSTIKDGAVLSGQEATSTKFTVHGC